MAGDPSDEVIAAARDSMEKSIASLKHDLQRVRTGRANPQLLDGVRVDYYGTPTPLNQLANLTSPDPRLLVVSPYDKGALPAIEKAILAADLGLNPANDGKLVRIPIPSLTEERRKQLVKKVNGLGEEARTAVRLLRREANDELKKLQKDGKLGEDDSRRAIDEVQKKTDKYVAEVEALCANKEKELMEV